MVIPKARKLKSGTWFIQLRINGESVPVSATTKKECEDNARHIKSEHKAGKRKKPLQDMTLREAIDRYIDSRDNVLSPATIRGYDSIRKNRFTNYMNISINRIDWQKMVNEESKIVSAKTIKNAWGLVSSALSYSELEASTLALPQVVRADKPWLEPEQILPFIKAVEGNRYERQILLALHGLRLSEILAIDSSKINLKKEHITVSGSVVRGRSGMANKPTNKNTSSNRIVPIMIPRLKELFAQGDVTKCDLNTIRENINRVCEKSGLPRVGTHGLRRSFASLCYHLKLSERETMELGGWSDAQTMRDIYIYLAQRDRQNAHSKLKYFYLTDQSANPLAF